MQRALTTQRQRAASPVTSCHVVSDAGLGHVEWVTSLPIVVVEDHTDSREAIAHALRAGGHTVIEASNAIDATLVVRTLLLEAKPPQLIIADVYMPGASGLTFVSGVRVIGVKSPVIIISAWPTADLRERAKRLDAHFLPKPLEPADLCRMVTTLLEQDAD
jgi:DNA-binding NtrC family response regulator